MGMGAKTMISQIKEGLLDHQLRTRIAKTTGNTIMIAGAIGALFTFGVTAIVAGAVGGAITVGTDITDWVVTDQKGKAIQGAMTEMNEFQYDFQQKYTAMQEFTASMSKKFNVDVPMFMGIMNNVKRAASDAKTMYTTFKGFQETYAMFQALRTGQSIEHVGVVFTNAADMTMMVNRVGMNLGKEVGTFTKFGVWAGEATGKLTSFLGKIAPIFNVVDIILTWVTVNPKITECDTVLKNLDEAIPELQEFAKTIAPVGERRLVRALSMLPGQTSKNTMRRLKAILVKGGSQ